MNEQQMRGRVRYVIGPDGSPLTLAELPPTDTQRWVIRRKAEVVDDVRGGLLSILKDYCPKDIGIYAVYPHNRYPAPKVRMFLDFLRERFKDESYWRA